jgi:hypothetical protein
MAVVPVDRRPAQAFASLPQTPVGAKNLSNSRPTIGNVAVAFRTPGTGHGTKVPRACVRQL